MNTDPTDYDETGVLPGQDWPPHVLDPEGDGDFILQWVVPVSDDPLTQASVSQARQQWRACFPNTDARDREMFMAGLTTAATWWAWQSIRSRNALADAGQMAAAYEPWVSLDDADDYMGRTITRIVTVLFNMDDDDDADLDDAFADLIERIDDDLEA